ncbi:hypothetical protein AAMO2058_000679600 [Amorphochlora amoebiformis]
MYITIRQRRTRPGYTCIVPNIIPRLTTYTERRRRYTHSTFENMLQTFTHPTLTTCVCNSTATCLTIL